MFLLIVTPDFRPPPPPCLWLRAEESSRTGRNTWKIARGPFIIQHLLTNTRMIWKEDNNLYRLKLCNTGTPQQAIRMTPEFCLEIQTFNWATEMSMPKASLSCKWFRLFINHIYEVSLYEIWKGFQWIDSLFPTAIFRRFCIVYDVAQWVQI